MPTQIDNKTIFTLAEVCNSIRKTIETRYTSSFWVVAEMNKLNHYTHSGHCYPELLEKKDGKVIAELRSILWRSDFQRINDTFLQTFQEPLKDGIKVLMLVSIQFDAMYGMSLRIKDIDPSFTLGELEKEKQASIQKLQSLGIFHQNKELPIPLLPQRIAIISVETSKGYADFLKVLHGNTAGFSFFDMLFPALLQGERSVTSILLQLERIRKVQHHFDAVAIIRGGGGDVGLSSYNNFELAQAIATFPLPVLTGVGHATNFTVVEMVSAYHGITPTAVGEWLIEKFVSFQQPILLLEKYVQTIPNQLIAQEKLSLQQTIRYFDTVVKRKTASEQANIRYLSQRIPTLVQHALQSEKQQLIFSGQKVVQQFSYRKQTANRELTHLSKELQTTAIQLLKWKKMALASLEKNVQALSPHKILQRGFSMTMKDNQILKSVYTLTNGDEIQTILADGNKIISQIKKIEINGK